MNYTLDNLKKAEAAIMRGDCSEALKYIKYLRQRMETLLWQRTQAGKTKGEEQ